MPEKYIERASVAIPTALGLGSAFGQWWDWLGQNAAAIGVVMAVATFLVGTYINIWYKCRLLRIAETKGLHIDGRED